MQMIWVSISVPQLVSVPGSWSEIFCLTERQSIATRTSFSTYDAIRTAVIALQAIDAHGERTSMVFCPGDVLMSEM